MRVFNRVIVLCILVISSWGCSKNLYPIRDKLRKSNVEKLIHETEYIPSNMFQLRITKTNEFLPVEVINGNKSQKLTSDLAVKRYQQRYQSQATDTLSENLTVEETYLYLENFNSSESMGAKYGYAYYFVTYPTIDPDPEDSVSRTQKYFNDSHKLYTNIIRQVKIGFWLKNSQEEILLLLKNDSKDIAVFTAHALGNGIGLLKTSHPSALKRNSKISEILEELITDLIEVDNREANSKPQTMIDIWFKQIKAQAALIDISSVLNVKDSTGLLFSNIPENKIFGYSYLEGPKEKFSKVKRFKIGLTSNEINISKKNFYFTLEGDLQMQDDYRFIKRNVYFIDNLFKNKEQEEWYSVL